MNWNDLNWESNYEPRTAYNQSKLANILFTRELAKKLEGKRDFFCKLYIIKILS